MRWHPHRAGTRVAGLLAALIAVSAVPGTAAGATVSPRSHPQRPRSAARARAEVARVERYWTPARMRSARPLELTVDGGGRTHLRLGRREPTASASFTPAPTPETPPYSVNGRIFIRRGRLRGYCSGTAINSPSRQLVLTAGHCVNSGPEGGKASVWSNYMEFVPAYTSGVAPFGAFVARRNSIFALKQWTNHGNPDFDLGAMVTQPNAEGVNVADAVGGGATIVDGLTRHQEFQSFGYPGESKRLQTCRSPYVGDDTTTYPFSGPPTMAIRCRWAPGASGGGWLIAEGTEIDGINTYQHLDEKSRTFGPYFAAENVGKLVRGL